MPIFLFGSEEQKREWLPDLASGQARRLRADRAGRRLDAGTRTTASCATVRGSNGSKMFITNAATDAGA